MSDKINIQSHKGIYTADFMRSGIDNLNSAPIENAIYIIDEKVAALYESRLGNIIDNQKIILIEAKEENKSLDKFPKYVEALVDKKIRRGQFLIAIGGGIIQDITCFLASTVMRGLPWIFYPTTLLAQSDSCIGSKSSINSGEVKNILGTFTPPKKVVIDIGFLGTLEQKDLFSGIGEMLKVHAIDSPESFDRLSASYEEILADYSVMEHFIHESLIMKKKLIEIDEFDTGPRNVMNYGHSFGHAIESATNYAIPHGIAVTMGMDMANFVAVQLGVTTTEHFERMHGVLHQNCTTYLQIDIQIDHLLTALSKDKKNTTTQLRLILPDENGCIGIGLYDNDRVLSQAIDKYFDIYRGKKI